MIDEKNPIFKIVEAMNTFRALCRLAGMDIRISGLEVSHRDMAYLTINANPDTSYYVDTFFNEKDNPTCMKIMGAQVKQANF